MSESGGIAEHVGSGAQRPAGWPRLAGLWRRHAAGAALPASLVLVALQVAAMVAGRAWLPKPPGGHPTSLASRLLLWDGYHYFQIATGGYSWNPAAAGQRQLIAFFPLQALIDRLFLPAGEMAPVLILLATLGFGIAAIFAFEGLARRLLPARATTPAVLCFAFWPASSFQMMGYPTGLISLCVLVALTCHLDGRFRRSAIWLGAGTAAAPTVIFVGAALGSWHGLAWLRAGLGPRRLLALALWSLIALSGVLGFMLYQRIMFHDPLAFVKAQTAWGAAPAPLARLGRLADLQWYLQQPRAALAEIHRGRALLAAGAPWQGAHWIEMGAQRFVNVSAFVVVLVGLVAASMTLRGGARVVVWAGWTVLLGYLWFIVSTDQNMLEAPRLLSPAVAAFAGWGMLLARAPRWLAGAAIGLLVAVSVAEMAAAAAGYWVA